LWTLLDLHSTETGATTHGTNAPIPTLPNQDHLVSTHRSFICT